MGREARCRALLNGAGDEGKVRLETDELVFRGTQRVSIRLADVRAVSAEQGRLTIDHRDGTAIFDLGAEAERWAHALHNPKGLIDKLGVKPGQRVALYGLDDDFRAKLQERGVRVVQRAARDADVIFVAADRKKDLARLESLRADLADSGALWVVRPKGAPEITESDVLYAGRQAGLVDVKVVRFSETHTAEKFVIPVAARG
jgi:hypothetical protein